MRLLLAGLLALVASVSGAVAMPASLSFSIVREGETIGTHVFRFASSGDETRVQINTDVAVKVLFVTAYKFQHNGTEVWRDGKLVAYTSQTDDDGAAKTLNAKANGEGLMVTGSAGAWTADAAIIPASLWDMRVVRQNQLLNTLDGRPMKIQVTDAGMDRVETAGGMVEAHHYVIAGDLQREVWYDADGVLSHVRFNGEDGSQIDYLRQ